MSTTPSDPGDRPGGYGRGFDAGRLPLAGNAELPIYLLVALIVAIIWLASDDVRADGFATLLVALTFGYLISRGIAKASRVDER